MPGSCLVQEAKRWSSQGGSCRAGTHRRDKFLERSRLGRDFMVWVDVSMRKSAGIIKSSKTTRISERFSY
jgi:hypothetical protein